MGNPYGDLPHSDPTRLTDSAEEYAPTHCPDCWGLTGDEQDYDGNEAACTCEYDEDGRRVLGDYAPALLMGDLLRLRDAFAAQAVAAERARLAVAISRAFYALPSSNGHEIKGQEQMCIAAINLVKGE